MFRHALVRRPGINFSEGITPHGQSRVDYEKALQQHSDYCDALRECGLSLITLEPDIRFPDCPFVEDTAIVAAEVAVITRPRLPGRQGEESEVKEALLYFRAVESIPSPGTVEGGDVLRAGSHFYIGISERTNQEGAGRLASILSRYGYTSSTIPVKSGLHLKSGSAYIGDNNIVSVDEFAEEFRDFHVIKVDRDEAYSANCLRVNDFLLMPKGFPGTRGKILALDYKVIEIEMSEFQKMNGGLTCLSILF